MEFDLVPAPDWLIASLKRGYRVMNFSEIAIILLEPSSRLQKWSVQIEEGALHLYCTARFSHEIAELFSPETEDVTWMPSENRRQLELLGELDKKSEVLWIM